MPSGPSSHLSISKFAFYFGGSESFLRPDPLHLRNRCRIFVFVDEIKGESGIRELVRVVLFERLFIKGIYATKESFKGCRITSVLR